MIPDGEPVVVRDDRPTRVCLPTRERIQGRTLEYALSNGWHPETWPTLCGGKGDVFLMGPLLRGRITCTPCALERLRTGQHGG